MSDIIDFIKNDKQTKSEVTKEMQEYSKQSLNTRAELGLNYLHKSKIYEKCINIMGDSIYDLESENQVLRQEMGEVDQVYIDKKVKEQKLSNDKNKNSIILNRLKKTVSKVKQI
jgi:type IV secretory pathway VirB4 component